jgi:long-chain acyl-CoA synthetase
MTYGDLAARAAEFAEHLAARGVRPGQRIALSIPNRPDLVVALLGALAAGVTVAPLDTLLKDEERAAIVSDLEPALLVESGIGGDLMEQLLPGGGPTVPAPALVLYTSGSTGRPKGSMLSHAALAFANRSWAGPVMGLREDDVVLAVLPLAHSFGLNGALLAPLLVGATVRLVERFVPGAVAEVLERDGVTVLPAVATMFQRLLDAGFAGASRLRLGVSGAAPCSWDLAETWRTRTGVRIVRGYGMTELFRPLSYLAGETADYPECVGRPVPGVEIRVVDDSGRLVTAGEEGELLIRTPAVMDGYHGSADDDTNAVLVDGWFRTGDLARVTADGYVAIVGRKRERIKRGGYSVFPAEVEAVLHAHPAVAEAAVGGVPDAALGEEVAAWVALRPGGRADADELIAWCRDRLAAFKYPRRVSFVAALPRSATGKILKSQLRQ